MAETLGEAWDQGWVIHLRCQRGSRSGPVKIEKCLYDFTLDMQTLVATRGRKFPLSLLASRLICPQCRGQRLTLAFLPPWREAGSSTLMQGLGSPGSAPPGRRDSDE